MSSAAGDAAEQWVRDAKISALIRHWSRKVSQHRGFGQSDRPDIEQEIFLDLLQKISRFDSARASRVTFAGKVVKNKAASMVRALRAQKRVCRSGTMSLNNTIHDSEGRVAELADTIDVSVARRHTGQRQRSEAELAQLRLDVAEANQQLSPELRDVAALLGHVPEYAAAQVLGISRRQTAVRVDALRKHYEERGLHL